MSPKSKSTEISVPGRDLIVCLTLKDIKKVTQAIPTQGDELWHFKREPIGLGQPEIPKFQNDDTRRNRHRPGGFLGLFRGGTFGNWLR